MDDFQYQVDLSQFLPNLFFCLAELFENNPKLLDQVLLEAIRRSSMPDVVTPGISLPGGTLND